MVFIENVIVEDNTILSYDLNGKTLSSDTIIEVEKDNIIYRFYQMETGVLLL